MLHPPRPPRCWPWAGWLVPAFRSSAAAGPLTITGIVPSTFGGAYDITYTNGSGSQFILLAAPNAAEAMSNWVPVATNMATPGIFTVAPTADAFYRIETR